MKTGHSIRPHSHRLAELSLVPYRKHETPLGLRIHAALGRALAGFIERIERGRHRPFHRC